MTTVVPKDQYIKKTSAVLRAITKTEKREKKDYNLDKLMAS